MRRREDRMKEERNYRRQVWDMAKEELKQAEEKEKEKKRLYDEKLKD